MILVGANAKLSLFSIVLLCCNVHTGDASLPCYSGQEAVHRVTDIFLVGIEGSSHHGISLLIPELNKLAFDSIEPECCDVSWTSYPSKVCNYMSTRCMSGVPIS
jgi:hypothetical protein